MDTLKTGSKVRMTAAHRLDQDLTVGNVYILVRDQFATGDIFIKDDKGMENGLFAGQFEPVTVAPTGRRENGFKPTAKIASDGGTTDYYKLPAHATELRHLIAHKKMNFHIGNIFKAAYRLGEKVGIDHRYDLKKIITMAQFELEELDRAEGVK